MSLSAITIHLTLSNIQQTLFPVYNDLS